MESCSSGDNQDLRAEKTIWKKNAVSRLGQFPLRLLLADDGDAGDKDEAGGDVLAPFSRSTQALRALAKIQPINDAVHLEVIQGQGHRLGTCAQWVQMI